MATAPAAPLILLRDAELYAPEALGRRDVLVGGGQLLAISERDRKLEAPPASLGVQEHDCAGAVLIPGLVDAHVHVGGGGGEGGFASRVPPLALSQFSLAGVSSVVGLLGTDSSTRTIRELLARTYGLREEGISAWCWTGSYELPVKTLTGSVRDDIVFLDPVIGVGELAISDHRSSQPTFDEFVRVAADVHVGGMIGAKAGVLHLHLGDGARGLELVRRALDETELPPRVFHPTHLNRKRELFEQAKQMVRTRERSSVGAPLMDVTAFPADDVGEGLSAAAAIDEWISAELPLARLSCSSDGGGCMPHFDNRGQLQHYGVGQCSTLLETLRELRARDHALERVLPLFTANVAEALRLQGKGALRVGADADLVVLDGELRVDAMIARGQWLVREGEPVVRGPFEPR